MLRGLELLHHPAERRMLNAKAHFQKVWLAFKEMHGSDRLARAYAAMNLREKI